ncbi:uncharacterized protein LOC124137522 [Haliotis rufescens]|uniref:uncharacterized protein LOC124137522 n=1 Tax=Haliotis rufescens TaxID=6454 RepID=UPI00201F4806|nr:uncharacterized protein LOC124137522 [Haliotis rufescens]
MFAYFPLVSVLVSLVSSQIHPRDLGNVRDFGPHSDDVIDVVPHHSTVGGYGEFIKDPVDVHGGDPIHDIVHDPQSNSVVKDVVPDSGHSGIVDFVPGPASDDVVYDVVPGSGPTSDAVHDVVPHPDDVVRDIIPESGSDAIVHDVIPSPSVVHDVIPEAFSKDVVHDVVPSSNTIVHDVVPSSTFPQEPAASDIVKDIIPSTATIEPDFPDMPHPDFPNAFPAPSHAPTTSPSLKNAAIAAPVVNPNVLKCGLKPEPYTLFQFSHLSYNYPKGDITFELEQRPKIRAAIFDLGTGGRFKGKYNLKPSMAINGQRFRRQATYSDGCQGQSLTLRRFYSYSNYCWVINPVYQDVSFHNCGHGCLAKASYGTVSRCEASYKQTGVWAYCAGLAYGERITKVTMPMPTSCTCKTYQCS